jgi:hypothetical protein
MTGVPAVCIADPNTPVLEIGIIVARYSSLVRAALHPDANERDY